MYVKYNDFYLYHKTYHLIMELFGYKVHMYYNVYNFQYFFILQVQSFCNTVEFAVLFSPCNHMPYIYIYIYI